MENKKIDFNYPIGFEEACKQLDFLPEEERAGFLSMFVSSILYL